MVVVVRGEMGRLRVRRGLLWGGREMVEVREVGGREVGGRGGVEGWVWKIRRFFWISREGGCRRLLMVGVQVGLGVAMTPGVWRIVIGWS
jgi:hypothetical protein